MPPLVWCKTVGSNANLGGHNWLELIIGNLQERQQLPDQDADVLLVDQGKAEVQCSSTNADIGIPETVQNGVPVSLNGIGFHCHDLDKCVQGNISDIVVPVGQEFTQNIDTKDAQTGVCFDVQNGKDGFVEDGVSDVLGGVRVCSNLNMSAAVPGSPHA